MHIPNFVKKWWFWVIVVLLIPVVWYVWGYVTWQLDRQDMLAGNRSAYLGWLKMETDQKALEAQYRADTYGGDTPEKTLQLFVEALEKKDYELAAKYFVPENQGNALRENRLGEAGGANALFIEAYRNGRIVPPGGVGSSGIYEIEVFPAGETIAYGVRLIENDYTGKWKIIEL